MATVTIEDKLSGIETSRNTIRAKLVELGLAESGAKLDALAAVIAQMINRGAVSVQIKEGETYTIPEGWHNVPAPFPALPAAVNIGSSRRKL